MVASTVCSSNGFTGTNVSAEAVAGVTAALEAVDVVIGRANEDETDFYCRRQSSALEALNGRATHCTAGRKRGLPYRQPAQLVRDAPQRRRYPGGRHGGL